MNQLQFKPIEKPQQQRSSFVPLSQTELRAWRRWWPMATTFDVLLMRKRNGGLLHCVQGGCQQC